MANSLIRFSLLMKNISTLSKCVSTTRFSHNFSDLKEITTELKAATADIKFQEPTRKQLFELLSDDSSLSSLIENLKANMTKIDSCHAVVALTTMHKYFEKNKMETSEIHNNEHFLIMCDILNRYLTSMELPQIVQSLKILNFLKVSSSSTVVQSLLQLVRHSVNDLTMHQIYYLTFLFKRMDPTPLSNAISISLPTVFTSQLHLKLDKEDIKELECALRYISENKTDEGTVQYILNAVDNNMQPIDLNTAVNILYSILTITNTSTSYHNVLFRMQNIILNESGDIRQQSVINIIVRMCNLIINGQEQYYNAAFLDKLIDYVITNNYGLSKGTFILNILNKIRFINIPLLKYLSQLCTSQPTILSQCSPLAISSIAMGLAIADFKPPNWNELQEIIVSNASRISNEPTLCYLGLRLASLDCLNQKLLDYIFSIDQDPNLMSYQYHQAVKRLYMIVKILHPNYSGRWPSEKLIDSFRESETRKHRHNMLFPALEKILKDPSLIKKKVKTHFGHEIDYLIVTKNDYPIVVEPKDSNSTTYVEDFIIPPESNKIAVLFFPSKAYGKNIPRIEASFAAYIKTLETLSFTVVHISERLWDKLYDYEKLPYLQYMLNIPSLKLDHKGKVK